MKRLAMATAVSMGVAAVVGFLFWWMAQEQ